MTSAANQNEPSPTAVDPGAQQVATIYSKAFLAAAEKTGETAAALDELDSFVAEVLNKFPRLESVLLSGFISAEEKVAILDRTLGNRASRLALVFLKVLAGHDRFDCVRHVIRVAREQFDTLHGRVKVHVTTATPLAQELSAKLTQQLRQMLGGEPVLVPRTDPDLIGGLVLHVGDTVYDGSIATQLAVARDRMINRSVHEIQSRRDRFGYPSGN